jgi:hypothetical protein
MQNFDHDRAPNIAVPYAFRKAIKKHYAELTEEKVIKAKLAIATTKGRKSKVTLPTFKCMEKK